ncbi:hypothetical protein LTR95_000998 [Oleoguttula sp. CCFEE 5521]
MESAGRIEWNQIGTSKQDCSKELTEFYWHALEIEVADAICSMNYVLQLRKERSDASLTVDSIEHRVSRRMAPPAIAWKPTDGEWDEESFDRFLESVKNCILDTQTENEDCILARAMLNGLGILDIDEVIEYRRLFTPSQADPPRFEKRADELTGNIEVSQHLVRSPHSYAVSPKLRAVLRPDDFYFLREQIQAQQDAVDIEEDRKAIGFVGATLLGTLASFFTARFPLGNVHSHIEFGPLIFENGVEDTKGGVRISARQSLSLGRSTRPRRKGKTLALDPQRRLFEAEVVGSPHRTQAVIKQILAGAFAGYHRRLQPLEDLLIKETLSCARKWREKPVATRQAKYNSVMKLAANIVTLMRIGFDDAVKLFLGRFVDALFDTNTTLSWNMYSNNCQHFCDALLHYSEFGTVFLTAESMQSFAKTEHKLHGHDYLISFRTETQLRKAIDASSLSIGPLSSFLKQLHHP